MVVRPIVLLFVVAAAAFAVLLARAAQRRWDDQRSRRTYELPPSKRPQVLRLLCTGSAAALTCSLLLLGTTVAGTPGGDAGSVGAGTAAARPADDSAANDQADPSPYHPRPRPRPGPAAPHSRRIAFHPVGPRSGGTLTVGRLPGAGEVRVWLPPHYSSGSHARHRSFPVALVPGPLPAEQYTELLEGFARRVDAGGSDPFVVVTADARTLCGRSGPRRLKQLRTAVTRSYRVLPAPAGWGVLGILERADCALRTGLRRPGVFGATVAVSARGPAGTTPAAEPSTPLTPNAAGLAESGESGESGESTDSAHPLLLVSAQRDQAAQQESLRLRTLLVGRAQVRIVDTVRDFDPAAERRRLFAVAAGYLTEQLDSPSGPEARQKF
jgi:hypothetical protein